MKVLQGVNVEKKDIVKAGNSVEVFKDIIGEPFKMTGAVIFEKTEKDKDGKDVVNVVSAIKKEDGEFVSSISPTIKNSLDNILGVYSEEEITAGLDVIIKAGTSNNNREFLYVDLV